MIEEKTKNSISGLFIIVLAVLFMLAVVSGVYNISQYARIADLSKEVENQKSQVTVFLTEKNEVTVEVNSLKGKLSDSQEKLFDSQKEVFELNKDLKTKSKEVLELVGKQRTLYEEQRAKWRNHVVDIMTTMVRELERTASKCWDSERNDYEDCLDDEFSDESDKPIAQVLNLA